MDNMEKGDNMDNMEKVEDKVPDQVKNPESVNVNVPESVQSESQKVTKETKEVPESLVVDNGTEGLRIENGIHKMKIRCEKCKLEDTLTEEDSKLLAHVVKRYNPNPVPGDYTAVLSIIKGNCTDGNKHFFEFDESFDKIVSDTIKEYYDAISVNVSRKETLEKISLLICETNSQIKSLGSTLLELEKKKEHILAEMAAGGILIENIKLKFMKLTGSEDVTIWSKI